MMYCSPIYQWPKAERRIMFKKHKVMYETILDNIARCDREIAVLKETAAKVGDLHEQIHIDRRSSAFAYTYLGPTLLGRVISQESRLRALEKYLGLEYEDSKMVEGRHKKKGKK